VVAVASSASEGKSNGRRALLHLSLWQDRFLCCYRDQNEARLLRSLCATSWQFWMQITRYQFEDSRSGFTFDAAIAEIKAKGYFLFTGSPQLLGKVVPTPGSEGPSNV